MKPIVKNSWQHAQEYKDRKLYTSKQRSEQLHDRADISDSEIVDFLDDDDSVDQAIMSSPVASFVFKINRGVMPSVEALSAICECFNECFEAEGALELEEVFFGPKRKGVGNRSAIIASQQQDDIFVTIHETLLEKHKTPTDNWASDVDIVENILAQYPHSNHKDADSVLKAYHRKLKDPLSVLAKFVKKEDI